ncbi:MAG: hypothetical protein ABIJ08_02940, partial [Nanoarchaeota archaeon]
MTVDDSPPSDCDSQAIGGFWDDTDRSSPWFSSMSGYLGSTPGDPEYDYLLKIMRASAEDDDDLNYRNYASIIGSIYCANNSAACNNLGGSNVCDTDCYNRITMMYIHQGYYIDTGTDDDTLYDDQECGDNDGGATDYVDGNQMEGGDYIVYAASMILQYSQSDSCEMSNEPPNASNVKIIPIFPTAGDDLYCNFTYSDVENYEERDSTFDWRKNGVGQSINSKILEKGNLSINDNWSCDVIPSDGLENGTKAGSSNVTIMSTIQNPKMYIEDSLAWTSDGYYADTELITNFVQELNNALENCTSDEEDYCNISLKFSSDSSGKINISDLEVYYNKQDEEGNLTITSLIELNSNNTLYIFEFIIKNNGETTLTDINWSFDTGEVTITANQLITLTSNENISVFIQNQYASSGLYTVNASATSGTITASKTLPITVGNATSPTIDVYNLTQLYSDKTRRIFEFSIKNLENNTMTNINWTLDTGEDIIYPEYRINLTTNESIYIITEYNYSSTGDYLITATGINGTNQDSETIEIDVEDIETSNLTVLNQSSTKTIFEFFI